VASRWLSLNKACWSLIHVCTLQSTSLSWTQVEEVRNPALRGKPLAVTQKYLVVTANYEARAAGVTKLMGLQDALKACPHLATVSA
jgi:nucleotidyltransferase/DNA polymerase involved in DNA repair